MEQNSHGCTELSSEAAYAVLRSLEDVHILIHRSPDGDCVGGGYAVYYILKSLGIRSRVCCADPIPAMFDEITQGVVFEDFEPKMHISVDVADKKLFGELPRADLDAEILLCIDHHISNTHYAKQLLWDPNASAACEVLFWMMQDNAIPITREIARCLYVGISTDTGCFQFSNASADTFAAVSAIKRMYPDLPYARLNRELFVLKSEGRIRLDTRLMQNIQRSENGNVALIYRPYSWMTELKVSADEVDGVANLPMQILGVEIGITCKQQSDGSFRVSMRGGEHADVSAVCRQFGGGGHVKASGCSFHEGEPAEVCRKLMETAEASLTA